MLPKSYYQVETLSDSNISAKSIKGIDPEELIRSDFDSAPSKEQRPLRFAKHMPVNYSIEDGTWSTIKDGKIWRLKITCEGAKSLDLIFTEINIDKTAELWTYSPDRTCIQGPITIKDAIDGVIWTPIILGSDIIIELFVPEKAHQEPRLLLTTINAGFRDFFEADKDSENKPCFIDVGSKEAAGFKNQIKAVAMVRTSDNKMGTGTLLNNVTEDGTPYFLTAAHLGITSNTRAASIRLHWNFELGTSNSGSGTFNHYQTGAKLLMRAPLTDFCLLKLNQRPNKDFKVYYSGWDASGHSTKGVAGIHHPLGKTKAICFSNGRIKSTEINGIDEKPKALFWKVLKWDRGRVDENSSGSGLWSINKKHPIKQHFIGLLKGGDSKCSGNKGPVWYAKLSRNWHSTSGVKGLRNWLDPDNTGKLKLDGKKTEEVTAKQLIALGNAKIGKEDCETYVSAIISNRLFNDGFQVLVQEDGAKNNGVEMIISKNNAQYRMHNLILTDPLHVNDVIKGADLSDGVLNTLSILPQYDIPEVFILKHEVIDKIKRKKSWVSLRVSLAKYSLSEVSNLLDY